MKVLDNKQTKLGILGGIVCFVSVFSQIPQIVDLGLTQVLAVPGWILLGILSIFSLKNSKDFPSIQSFIFVHGVFILFLAVTIFVNSEYLSSPLIYPIFLCAFILIIGCFVGTQLVDKDIDFIILCYIIASLAVGFSVFSRYLRGADLSSRVYAYASKNSVSQILMTSVILMAVELIKDQKQAWIITVAYLAGISFLTYNLIYLKSRATIIFFPLLIVCILLKKKDVNPKRKKIIIALAVLVLLAIFLNREWYNSIVNDVLLGGRESDDINDISSGRWEDWSQFFYNIDGHYLLGYGRYIQESFILTSLLSFGVPMGLLLIFWALYPFLWSFRRRLDGDPYMFLLILLSSCYFINGIFEELAPFGPGVKCFFLWFLFGVLMARKRKKENQLDAENKSLEKFYPIAH